MYRIMKVIPRNVHLIEILKNIVYVSRIDHIIPRTVQTQQTKKCFHGVQEDCMWN